jgi:hypothetical protein
MKLKFRQAFLFRPSSVCEKLGVNKKGVNQIGVNQK